MSSPEKQLYLLLLYPHDTVERGRNWIALASYANQVLCMTTFLVKKSTIGFFPLTSIFLSENSSILYNS